MFRVTVALAVLVGAFVPVLARAIAPDARITETRYGVHVETGSGTIDAEIVAEGILRVDVCPDGKKSPRTLLLDPTFAPHVLSDVRIRNEDKSIVVQSARISVSISHSSPIRIAVRDATGALLVEQLDAISEARTHEVVLHHQFGENLYGMRGLERLDNGGTLLRNNGAEVRAGAQGDGGAPWFFTTRYGVLIDSDGGTFATRDGTVDFSGDSRDDAEYFVIEGQPLDVLTGLGTLTGRPPLPPKWTLGFINSQWGPDEADIKQMIATYRVKHIPIDALILDIDWKAWGEDDYGEWRWNSTSSSENVAPDKFPDGASGDFARELRANGIKLCGILKPRVLLYKKGSTTQMHKAALYAEANRLWYPNEPPVADNPPVRDLDFAKAEMRSWYWKHLEPSFDAGMTCWWNDEADHTFLTDGQTFNFNNFQFFNMGRMLYEGQRSHSDLRVWSLNRSFYVGAQRYGYALWSGDIETGFESMQEQRMRMLTSLDLGESHWAMDTGGFYGHPSPENYTRWMQFSAFAPIFRTHGYFMEKRQPWAYGPAAEEAATRVIQLRYELLPYIYSYERIAAETGIGIVRPLFWMFPNDPQVANKGDSWMFGDALLVSPVVSKGASIQQVYLPAGTWYDFARGTRLHGGQVLNYRIDSHTWQDIPIFVRAGAIIATQPKQDYVDQHPISEITLDVFPTDHPSRFIYYDDDGTTYAYERGVYYRQLIRLSSDKSSIQLTFDAPSGTFQPALRRYLVRVHSVKAKAILLNGIPLKEGLLSPGRDEEWAKGHDRFSSLIIIRIDAHKLSGTGSGQQIQFQLSDK